MSWMQRARLARLVRMLALPAIVSALTLLLLEGAHAIRLWRRPDVSLSYKAYELAVQQFAAKAAPRGDGTDVIERAGQIEALLEEFRSQGIGIGNTPYESLVTPESASNYVAGGCLRMKPDLDKTQVFLRTLAFDVLHPPFASWDTRREIDTSVAAFFASYGSRRIRMRSNHHGERLTLPEVPRADKVLVAGDSVALGVGVNDEETLASRLQALDPALEYVNLGVGGAEASDIVCQLEHALERYTGHVARLVYVFCENDFEPGRPYGRPEELVAWLVRITHQQRIARTTVVYAPYVYNVFPEVTRIPGQRGWEHLVDTEAKERLRQLVGTAGFGWVDIADIGRQAVAQRGSLFAGLGLFVDAVHLSPEGTQRTARRIANASDLAAVNAGVDRSQAARLR